MNYQSNQGTDLGKKEGKNDTEIFTSACISLHRFRHDGHNNETRFEVTTILPSPLPSPFPLHQPAMPASLLVFHFTLYSSIRPSTNPGCCTSRRLYSNTEDTDGRR